MKIAQKELSISLVGLGYVGLPIAIAFSKHVPVIGFDINPEKIELYQKGIDPTCEAGEAALKSCSVKFSSNAQSLQEANFHIVAVPTPLAQDHRPDLKPLKSASKLLGKNLQRGSIVVYESTVYPGLTEEICLPILEKESGLVCGKDFAIGYSPERINPGDKVHRLENIVKIVSAQDEETLETIANAYRMVVEAGVYKAPSIKVAEAAKVIENSQRDINIAFMNELSIIFHKMGIDTNEVLKAAETKWNFLPFRPGLVGGHCIGIDPYYLTYKAETMGYHSEVILAGRRINDFMGAYVASNAIKLLAKAKKDISQARIGILGLTFKENCPDIRNTRVIDIIRELGEYGLACSVCDPLANAQEAKKEFGISLVSLEEMSDIDCLILAVGHAEFVQIDWNKFLNPGGILMDVKGICKPLEGHPYWRL